MYRENADEKELGFFEVMKPNIKKAFIFLILAKICCFTIAPAFAVLAWLQIIPGPARWVGVGIYGIMVALSLYFGLKEHIGKNIPSKKEVERWMKHYNLERAK